MRAGADDERGEVVVGLVRELDDRAQQVAGRPVVAEPVGEALEPVATEERTGMARLDEAVGEEAEQVALAQHDRRLAPSGRQPPAQRRRGAHRHRRVAGDTEDDGRGVAGARVGQRAGVGVVDRDGRGGEVAVE